MIGKAQIVKGRNIVSSCCEFSKLQKNLSHGSTGHHKNNGLWKEF